MAIEHMRRLHTQRHACELAISKALLGRGDHVILLCVSVCVCVRDTSRIKYCRFTYAGNLSTRATYTCSLVHVGKCQRLGTKSGYKSDGGAPTFVYRSVVFSRLPAREEKNATRHMACLHVVTTMPFLLAIAFVPTQ